MLEIGAGLGSLTRLLAQSARRVVAVEIDRKLIPPLNEVMGHYENCEIIQGDILEVDPAVIVGEKDYLVVANIPYYITSAIIRHLLSAEMKPSRVVLTMQQEVAKRICAEPGDLSLLALSVQVFGTPRIMTTIPAGAFFPPPKVDSATLRIDIYDEPYMNERQLTDFFFLAKAGFSQKRKMLRNTLSAGLKIPPENAGQLLQSAGSTRRGGHKHWNWLNGGLWLGSTNSLIRPKQERKDQVILKSIERFQMLKHIPHRILFRDFG